MELETFNIINKKKRSKRRLFIVVGGFLLLLMFSWFFYKASNILTIAGEVGVYDNFKLDKEENRLDILILGIRGAGDENGGLLADTMILISFDKDKEKAAMISLPRDLIVEMPNHSTPEKINFAYALGEQRRWGGGGLALSKEIVKYITGVYVDNAIVMNFGGFKELVDTLGGVKITRTTQFVESKQWQGEGKEDSDHWRLIELDEEDGVPAESVGKIWEFFIPEGTSLLSGEDALYYVRSRFSSSDFDRIKRQQEVISALKTKTLSLGVLTNPIKVFSILDILGNNVRTDMGLGDIREVTTLAQKYDRIPVETALLDISDEGLLVSKTINGSFVLVPKAGDEDFSEIREFFRNIFD